MTSNQNNSNLPEPGGGPPVRPVLHRRNIVLNQNGQTFNNKDGSAVPLGRTDFFTFNNANCGLLSSLFAGPRFAQSQSSLYALQYAINYTQAQKMFHRGYECEFFHQKDEEGGQVALKWEQPETTILSQQSGMNFKNKQNAEISKNVRNQLLLADELRDNQTLKKIKTKDEETLFESIDYGISEWTKNFVFYQPPNSGGERQAGRHDGQSVLFESAVNNFTDLTNRVEILNQQIANHMTRLIGNTDGEKDFFMKTNITLNLKKENLNDYHSQRKAEEDRRQRAEKLYHFISGLTPENYTNKINYLKEQARLYKNLITEIKAVHRGLDWKEISNDQFSRLTNILTELYLVTNNVETETMSLYSFLLDVEVQNTKLQKKVIVDGVEQQFAINFFLGSKINDGYYQLGGNTSALWEHRTKRGDLITRHMCLLFNLTAPGGYHKNDKRYWTNLNDRENGFRFAINQGDQEMNSTRMILDIQEIRNLQMHVCQKGSLFKPQYGFFDDGSGRIRIKFLFYYCDGVSTKHVEGYTCVNLEGMNWKHDRTNGHHMLKKNRGIEQAICIENSVNRQLQIMEERGPLEAGGANDRVFRMVFCGGKKIQLIDRSNCSDLFQGLVDLRVVDAVSLVSTHIPESGGQPEKLANMTQCQTTSPNFDFYAPEKVQMINHSPRITLLDLVIIQKDLIGKKGKRGLSDDFGFEMLNHNILVWHPEDRQINFRFNINDSFLFFDSIYYKGVKKFMTSLFAENFQPNIGVTLQYLDKKTPMGDFYIINQNKDIEAKLSVYSKGGDTYQQYQVKERANAFGENLHENKITIDGLEFDLNQVQMQPRSYIHKALKIDCSLSGAFVNIADPHVVSKILHRYTKIYNMPHPYLSSIDSGIVVNAHQVGVGKKYPLQIQNTLYSPTGKHSLCMSTSGYLSFGEMTGLNDLEMTHNEDLVKGYITKGQNLKVGEEVNYHAATLPITMNNKEKLDFTETVVSQGAHVLRKMKHVCETNIVKTMLEELLVIMPDVVRTPKTEPSKYSVFGREKVVTNDLAGKFRPSLEIIKNVVSLGQAGNSHETGYQVYNQNNYRYHKLHEQLASVEGSQYLDHLGSGEFVKLQDGTIFGLGTDSETTKNFDRDPTNRITLSKDCHNKFEMGIYLTNKKECANSISGLFADSGLVYDPWNKDSQFFAYDLQGATDAYIIELVRNLSLYQLDTSKLSYKEIANRLLQDKNTSGLKLSINDLYNMNLCRSSMTPGEIGYSNQMLNLVEVVTTDEEKTEMVKNKTNIPLPAAFKRMFTMSVLDVVEKYAKQVSVENSEVSTFVKSYIDQAKKDINLRNITFRALVESGQKTNETYGQEFVRPVEKHFHTNSDIEKVLTLCTSTLTNIVKFKSRQVSKHVSIDAYLHSEAKEFFDFAKNINATVNRLGGMELSHAVNSEPVDDVILCSVAAFSKMIIKRLKKLMNEYAGIVSSQNSSNIINFKKKFNESKQEYFCNCFIGIFSGQSSNIGRAGVKNPLGSSRVSEFLHFLNDPDQFSERANLKGDNLAYYGIKYLKGKINTQVYQQTEDVLLLCQNIKRLNHEFMFVNKKYGLRLKDMKEVRLWCKKNKENEKIRTAINSIDEKIGNIDFEKLIHHIEEAGMDESELDLEQDSIHDSQYFMPGEEHDARPPKLPVDPLPKTNDKLIAKMREQKEGVKTVGCTGAKPYKETSYISPYGQEPFVPHEESCQIDKGGLNYYGYTKAVVTSEIVAINDNIIEKDRKQVTQTFLENPKAVVNRYLKSLGLPQTAQVPEIEYTKKGLNKVKACFNLQAPIIFIHTEKLHKINAARLRSGLEPIKIQTNREFESDAKKFYKYHQFSRSERNRFKKMMYNSDLVRISQDDFELVNSQSIKQLEDSSEQIFGCSILESVTASEMSGLQAYMATVHRLGCSAVESDEEVVDEVFELFKKEVLDKVTDKIVGSTISQFQVRDYIDKYRESGKTHKVQQLNNLLDILPCYDEFMIPENLLMSTELFQKDSREETTTTGKCKPRAIAPAITVILGQLREAMRKNKRHKALFKHYYNLFSAYASDVMIRLIKNATQHGSSVGFIHGMNHKEQVDFLDERMTEFCEVYGCNRSELVYINMDGEKFDATRVLKTLKNFDNKMIDDLCDKMEPFFGPEITENQKACLRSLLKQTDIDITHKDLNGDIDFITKCFGLVVSGFAGRTTLGNTAWNLGCQMLFCKGRPALQFAAGDDALIITTQEHLEPIVENISRLTARQNPERTVEEGPLIKGTGMIINSDFRVSKQLISILSKIIDPAYMSCVRTLEKYVTTGLVSKSRTPKDVRAYNTQRQLVDYMKLPVYKEIEGFWRNQKMTAGQLSKIEQAEARFKADFEIGVDQKIPWTYISYYLEKGHGMGITLEKEQDKLQLEELWAKADTELLGEVGLTLSDY